MKKVEARCYHRLQDGLAACTLCPQRCVIKPGGTGKCLVRGNEDGTLFAQGYGRITALALDPIEKKPLALFHPGSQILSVGFYGCNFSCTFCQNHRISQNTAPFRELSPSELVSLALDAKSEGNIGIAYTYNEPLTSYEFVFDCARLAHQNGLLNVLVTNGSINEEPMRALLPHIDAMNIDLKAFSNEFYQKQCGARIEPVKQTIALCANACHVEVTTLVIPGHNDSFEEIESIAHFLSAISPNIPLHLTRHHPDYKMETGIPVRRQRLLALADRARLHLKYVFCGNL